MDSRDFFRAMDPSQFPFLLQSGLTGLHGLQGLNGLVNPLLSNASPAGSGRSKLAREEALLEAKIIQIILSSEPGECEETLKPNSRKSVSVGGHSICVVYRDDANSGYRIWEWHGHILIFDEEKGYSPEYIYGNFFQPLQSLNSSSSSLNGILNGVGLTGLIINGSDSTKKEQVVHRPTSSQTGKK